MLEESDGTGLCHLLVFLDSPSLSTISNTRKSVSAGNTEKWVEKKRRGRVFLTNSEVFGYLMKHYCECLI